ncbi:MAG: GWxTD domain-containing protein [Candidatus Neomarinimicrobiota bacterium]|jgi:GWxTD domain-containing protein
MRPKIILMLLCLLVVNSLAVEFDVDYAVFKGSEEVSVVEVYLLIPRTLFKFVPEQDQYYSDALIRVALAQNDTVSDIQEWQIADRVIDTLRLSSNQKIPEIATLQVKPGNYQLIVIVADINTQQQYRYDNKIEVTDFSSAGLKLSDIQVSSQITKTSQENKFSKYFGYDIIPNASAIFSENQAVIYSFLEIYNLKTDPSTPSNYKVKYSIDDLNDKEVIRGEWRTKKKPGESAVEIGSLNIASLPGGLYDLKVAVTDETTEQTVADDKRFYIVKSPTAQSSLAMDIEAIQLEGKSEEELDEIFGPLRYFATETEIKRFKKSDINGKKQIILSFWNHRDKNPQTPINEERIEFEQRLRYVNEQYSTKRASGWKSDFGRIYLMYGIPSEIERFPSSLESKPYQIWYYNEIEGGVKFYFVDKTGFGTYELVHSTARNEMQDINWQRWISPYSTSPNLTY